jgi:hypothetical protein
VALNNITKRVTNQNHINLATIEECGHGGVIGRQDSNFFLLCMHREQFSNRNGLFALQITHTASVMN